MGRSMPYLNVSVVLPAYNEEPNIAKAVAHASEVAGRLFADHEVIVVDDGSTDGTARVAGELEAGDERVRLLRHDRNRGYGEALRTGFEASRLDYLFFTDSDLQFDMGELERFLEFVDSADVVAGYRLDRHDPLPRRIMGHAWNVAVRALFDVRLRDINCAFKLFDNRMVREIEIESAGAMVNTELIVKLRRNGARVVEVGVNHHPRPAGKAGGGDPRVIATAFREMALLRRQLRSEDPPRRRAPAG